MDPRQFDALVRALAGSRRGALKLALGGVLAALGGRASAAAAPPFPIPPQDRCHGPGHRCAHGTVCCTGACVDTQTDPHNCGGCGVDCGGGTCCSGSCVDTSSDPNNCGACGAVCTLDLCDQGRCGCGQGSEVCNGACVDTSSDMNNCGACGAVCTLDLCANGRCGCGEGSVACNGRCVGPGASCATSADCCGLTCADNGFGNLTCQACTAAGQACASDAACCGSGEGRCLSGSCHCCTDGFFTDCHGNVFPSPGSLCCDGETPTMVACCNQVPGQTCPEGLQCLAACCADADARACDAAARENQPCPCCPSGFPFNVNGSVGSNPAACGV